MDPAKFRMMNLVGEGEINTLGKSWSGVKAKETLQAALDAAAWKSPKGANVGRGVAMYERGTGAGKSGSISPRSSMERLTVFTVAGDQGTGLQTVLCQPSRRGCKCLMIMSVAASATPRMFRTASTLVSVAAGLPTLTAPRHFKPAPSCAKNSMRRPRHYWAAPKIRWLTRRKIFRPGRQGKAAHLG